MMAVGTMGSPGSWKRTVESGCLEEVSGDGDNDVPRTRGADVPGAAVLEGDKGVPWARDNGRGTATSLGAGDIRGGQMQGCRGQRHPQEEGTSVPPEGGRRTPMGAGR